MKLPNLQVAATDTRLPRGEKRVERWLSALSLIPWLLIIGAYMEACVVRLSLSRWPRPMFDDPKQLATAPLHLVFQVLSLSLRVAIPLLLVFGVWNGSKILNDWRNSLRIGIFAIGLLAIWLLAHYDPGRVWDWFLD
jgi:hypothetical protein